MNVDAWLATLPAGTLDGWFEYYKLEPWGDDWERSSMVAVEILNGLQAVAAGFGGDSSEEPTPIPYDAFVPYRKITDPREAELESSLKALESLRGI